MRILITFLILTFCNSTNSSSLNIIRDAEIENLLKDISIILTRDTELEKQKLNFFIDNKKYINAMVTPTKQFFFTTELLLKSKTVDDLAGVISHEIGHIIGGHFQKRQMALEKNSIVNFLSSILAVGAIAGGAYEAGSAILMGGQHLSTAKLLAFSRSQESLADQTAIRLLKNNGFSLQGIINVFEQIQRNQKFKKFNPYFLTHPLSSERIRNIKLNIENEIPKKYTNLNYRFKLAKAKLNGFFLEKEQVDHVYTNTRTIEFFYANALNTYKVGKVKSAINFINKCIEYDSNNPYFHELKGQIYFENGKFREAIKSFLIANSILPLEKSFQLFLAKSLYHSGEKKNREKSINLLLNYIKKDDFPIDAWHYLGLNYGKLNMLDFSSHAFAEKYVLIDKIDSAKIHLNKARKITKNKVLLKKLKDIEYEIIKREKK